MTRLFSILFFLLTLSLSGQSLKTISLEEQLEDIEFIKTELQKFHPGVYTYQTEQEFEKDFETLIAGLQEDQTVIEFYKSLVPVINQVGCGHTTSKIPSKEIKRIHKARRFLPFEVKIIENRIFISKIFTASQGLFPGLEILSIDDILASDYIKSNLNRYPSDARILSRKYQYLEKNFAIDYSTFYWSGQDFKIVIRDANEVKNVTITGISYKDYILKTSSPKLDEMEFILIDSISTAIITIRNSKSKKAFDEFLQNSFSQIQVNKVSKLIIDLRHDSFNRDSDGAELFSYLTTEPFRYYDKLEVTKSYDVPRAMRWFASYPIEQDSLGKYYWQIHQQLAIQKPKPRSFDGEVFVLTDGFTFSAASEFSSIFKSTKRGTLVGLETGGSYYGNNSGGMLRKLLPNSKIIVYVPPIHYILAVKDVGNYARGVIPDVLVVEKATDFSLNQDVIRETALDLIREDY